MFQTHSQSISKEEPKIQVIINTNGDTLLQFTIADARIILSDLLQKKVADSLITEYMLKDTLNQSTITLDKREIDRLNQKIINLEEMNGNYGMIVHDKDSEITFLQDENKKLKKEIRKQKILKKIGFAGSIVLPIVVLILLTIH